MSLASIGWGPIPAANISKLIVFDGQSCPLLESSAEIHYVFLGIAYHSHQLSSAAMFRFARHKSMMCDARYHCHCLP